MTTLPTGWHEDECRLGDLVAAIDAPPAIAPRLCAEQHECVPIYDGAALRRLCAADDTRRTLMAEWNSGLMHGAGIVVIRDFVDDLVALDAGTALFKSLIAEERAAGRGGADHFAKPGANDRLWNALQKHCLREPKSFARYYANELLETVCEAWLGPAYQVTAQINVVNPGGAAQSPHRDYHLGFMTPAEAQAFPAHTHALSPVLTLQGAIAHVDMPLESGPTLYLPFSQRYAPGYLAVGREDFSAYFERHHVQLPLARGDAVFFNPALLHAAGHNRTADIHRMANLLQVSSALGRAMESVDRVAMSRALYPALQALLASGTMTMQAAQRAIAACAEGYAFPTNLDLDPPVDGLAPQSAQALMRRALREGWSAPEFDGALAAHAQRRRP
jgi:ectoine hydroxylase-related dioxygenase (phytanoyl-CoA dioxygenase family)